MGYYVSNMIGIRTGGVFSGDTDIGDMKERISKIILEMREDEKVPDPNMGNELGDPSHCMSSELTARKGSFVVLAGVFNYWTFDKVSIFTERVSKEFGTEVLVMSWDEMTDNVQCQIWLDGEPLFEVLENPLGQIMRRVF